MMEVTENKIQNRHQDSLYMTKKYKNINSVQSGPCCVQCSRERFGEESARHHSNKLCEKRTFFVNGQENDVISFLP